MVQYFLLIINTYLTPFTYWFYRHFFYHRFRSAEWKALKKILLSCVLHVEAIYFNLPPKISHERLFLYFNNGISAALQFCRRKFLS